MPFLLATALVAGVEKTPEAALLEYFGEKPARKPVYIKKEDVAGLEKKTGKKLESRLFTFYYSPRKKGYAVFLTHRVRTKDETIAVFLRSDGTIDQIELISFFEPEEYMPPARWLKQFSGKTGDELEGINAMTGATLTSNAILNSVRYITEIFRYGIVNRRKP